MGKYYTEFSDGCKEDLLGDAWRNVLIVLEESLYFVMITIGYKFDKVLVLSYEYTPV
jgi:hypothetical protein